MTHCLIRAARVVVVCLQLGIYMSGRCKALQMSLVGFCVGLLQACNSHSYHAEAQQYLSVAREVLIENGVCINPRDCSQKELLFFESGRAVHINIYQVNNSALVEQVAFAFKAKHTQLKEPKVVLTTFSSRHMEPKVKFEEITIQ